MTKMPIITLLTDFGTSDEYVGVMKGVILSLNPDCRIIDITHHVPPQDIAHAAYLIESAYRYFPPGTIHVVVVDPGVGTDRRILAALIEGHIFLAPDNGVLSLLIAKAKSLIRVENSRYFLPSISRTFHGRDIFAPVAAHISIGTDLSELGSPISCDTAERLPISEPRIENGMLVAEVVCADRFGNLMTNISVHHLGDVKRIELRIGEHEITGLSESYGDVSEGAPLTIIGSRGYLEIAVNRGNAKEFFGVGRGTNIFLTILRP